ncbi:hypothetical protein IU449_27720 [Nocardia higoensis]|uniref:DUF3040 family protein n=1 Tax=Nocardia higoensis TaxID=228599 RepID=A0ABS0DIK5_9NOCA|nr:hypothetical protein [Nocardia higoensis]MBF6358291.1 hypothetical protein [Nocardia higoensis]
MIVLPEPTERKDPAHVARRLLDLTAFGLVLAGVLVMVVIGKADPTVIAAAGAFVATVFGLWIRLARPTRRDNNNNNNQ